MNVFSMLRMDDIIRTLEVWDGEGTNSSFETVDEDGRRRMGCWKIERGYRWS